jgi:hypothetical protein
MANSYITSSSGKSFTEVETYADLPQPASSVAGQFFWVKTKTGSRVTFNRRDPGYYKAESAGYVFDPDVRYATDAEVAAGVDTESYLSPATLKVVSNQLEDYIYAVSILLK